MEDIANTEPANVLLETPTNYESLGVLRQGSRSISVTADVGVGISVTGSPADSTPNATAQQPGFKQFRPPASHQPHTAADSDFNAINANNSVSNGEPATPARNDVHASLKGRVFRKSKCKWSLGAAAAYFLSTGGALTAAGLLKASLLTTAFGLATGGTGILLSVAIYGGLLLIGVGVTYAAYRKGARKGEAAAARLDVFDERVSAEMSRRMKQELQGGDPPEAYLQRLTAAGKAVANDAAHQRNLEVGELATVETAMREHLMELLHVFHYDLSPDEAEDRLKQFGNSFVEAMIELRDLSPHIVGLQKAHAIYQCRLLLNLIARHNPPATADEIAQAQSKALVSFFKYHFLYEPRDGDGSWQSNLRDVVTEATKERPMGDDDFGDALEVDALNEGKPLDELFFGTAAFNAALPNTDSLMKTGCRYRNELVKEAGLALRPDNQEYNDLFDRLEVLEQQAVQAANQSRTRSDLKSLAAPEIPAFLAAVKLRRPDKWPRFGEQGEFAGLAPKAIADFEREWSDFQRSEPTNLSEQDSKAIREATLRYFKEQHRYLGKIFSDENEYFDVDTFAMDMKSYLKALTGLDEVREFYQTASAEDKQAVALKLREDACKSCSKFLRSLTHTKNPVQIAGSLVGVLLNWNRYLFVLGKDCTNEDEYGDELKKLVAEAHAVNKAEDEQDALARSRKDAPARPKSKDADKSELTASCLDQGQPVRKLYVSACRLQRSLPPPRNNATAAACLQRKKLLEGVALELSPENDQDRINGRLFVLDTPGGWDEEHDKITSDDRGILGAMSQLTAQNAAIQYKHR